MMPFGHKPFFDCEVDRRFESFGAGNRFRHVCGPSDYGTDFAGLGAMLERHRNWVQAAMAGGDTGSPSAAGVRPLGTRGSVLNLENCLPALITPVDPKIDEKSFGA